MSSHYAHRSLGQAASSNRLNELLEALRTEVDSITQDASVYKIQRDEYEHKSGQVSELKAIQQNLFELERVHSKLKQQFEEEVLRLRSQLDRNVVHPNTHPIHPRPQPPNIGSGPTSLFSNVGGGPGPTLMDPSQSSNGDKGYPNGNKRMRMDQDMQPLSRNPIDNQLPLSAYKPKPSGPISGVDMRTSHPQHPNMVKNRKSSVTSNMNTNQRVPSSTPPVRGPPPTIVSTLPLVPLLSDFSEADIPSNLKILGPDWHAFFHPKAGRKLTIDLLSTLEHGSVVCCVRFSPDGKYVATGCNKTAQIFDVSTSQKICTLMDESTPNNQDLYIRSVCFSPDGRYLATGAEDKLIRIWDINKKKIKHLFQGHELDIYSLNFSPDGRLIVSGSGDATARVWDTESGKGLFILTIEDTGAKDAGVTSVAVSPDGRLIAAGSLDKLVRVWDLQTGFHLHVLEGHLDSVYSVAFSPDGKTLISGSLDKTIKLWDIPSSRDGAISKSPIECTSTFSGHKDYVLSVAFSRLGNWIVSGSKDKGVQFWDPQNPAYAHALLVGHKNSVISVSLSSTSNFLATASGDCKARIWSFDNFTS